ncbi:MAG: macro domain-containing protein [Balneolaceae bacterium]|nr:macro domain-containing protein [Balneolaceae bacterium]
MTISLIDKINLEIRKGDITKQPDCDSIVNAANAQLKSGGGVAGAIHSIGDPELEIETSKFAPIKTGEAVITSAPKMPNRYIVHCLGPVYGKDKPEDMLLGNCYKNALLIADKYEVKSIAFPAISTGIFGYPVDEAARVAFSTIQSVAHKLTNIKTIRSVLWSDEDYKTHEKVLEDLVK